MAQMLPGSLRRILVLLAVVHIQQVHVHAGWGDYAGELVTSW